jgi:hypothetical protein
MGNPLYSLVAEKTGHERPTVTAPFGPTSTVAGAPPDGALAPKNHLRGNGAGGGVLQVMNRREGLRWSVSTVAAGNDEGGSVLGQNTRGGPLFIGGFRSLHSQGGLRPNPSLNGFKSTKFGDKIDWGSNTVRVRRG